MPKAANNYYNKIAKIYDLMYTKETGYNHKNQVDWVDNWRKKTHRSKTVLDLACGTGIHLEYFKKLGYKIQGIDASQKMLNVAKKRLGAVSLKKDFFETFNLKKKPDIITCYFNGMSYNTDLRKLKSTFKNIYKSLPDKGIFIFDVFCIEKSKKIFAIKKFENKKIKISRTIIGLPTNKGFKSTMYYIIFDGKKSDILSETSLRGTFSKKQILNTLSSSNFKVLYCGKGYAPEYTVFIAQKQLLN